MCKKPRKPREEAQVTQEDEDLQQDADSKAAAILCSLASKSDKVKTKCSNSGTERRIFQTPEPSGLGEGITL